MLTYDDRRESPRVLTTLWVRGLGADHFETERLGDLSIGGIGFELPEAPDADVYLVKFNCPGEQVVRKGFADVVDATPMPGTVHREAPFFVHLSWRDLEFDHERAIARHLDRVIRRNRHAARVPSILSLAEEALHDFEVDEAVHSLVPVAPHEVRGEQMSSLPERLRKGTGHLGDYLWGYLKHQYRPTRV